MKMIRQSLVAVGLSFSLMASALAGMVNINKADALTIQDNLKGIGKVKAERIIKYRKKHGAFKSIDDLVKVKGIGEKLLNKNRKDISLTKGAVKTVEKDGNIVKMETKTVEKTEIKAKKATSQQSDK